MLQKLVLVEAKIALAHSWQAEVAAFKAQMLADFAELIRDQDALVAKNPNLKNLKFPELLLLAPEDVSRALSEGAADTDAQLSSN